MDCAKSPRRRWLENNKKILMGIAVVVILALVLYSQQSKNKVRQRSFDIKPSVEVVVVHRLDMMKKIELSGKTVPEAQVDISAKYTGKIAQIHVELGQEVAPGQILLVQDTDDVDASLLQYEAALRGADADAIESNASFEASYHKAKHDYQLSSTNYQRYKTLYAMGAVSKQALDNAAQAMITAKAALDTWAKQIVTGTSASVMSKQAARDKAKGAILALQNQKDDMIMRAPRAGIIGFRQAEVGNLAQAGQKLLSIIDTSKIYVDCPVSEQDIGQIVRGAAADVAIESLGKTFGGKIIYISPSMEATTQSFTVRLALEGADKTLKAGMFARTEINILLRRNTLFVPKEAIVSLNGKERVFVIDDSNKAVERIVKTGLRNDSCVEILDGINEYERVAVSNLARLKAGTAVNPTEAAQ